MPRPREGELRDPIPAPTTPTTPGAPGGTTAKDLVDLEMGGAAGGVASLDDLWDALKAELALLDYDMGYREEDLLAQLTNIQNLRERIARTDPELWPNTASRLQVQLSETQAQLLTVANELWGPGGGAGGVEAITSFIERFETRTVAKYFDVPTPEDFLDNFDIALATHVQGLVVSGELDKDTARWILDNPDILLDEYIAELGSRAQAGEQIFKVVGIGGEDAAGEGGVPAPELLGTRPGRQEERDIQTLTQTTAAVTPTGGPGAVTQRTTQERLKSTLDETEEVFARPRLDYVYAISPLDWLAEYGTGTEIKFGAEREKSRRIGERRGPTVITPRRVQ